MQTWRLSPDLTTATPGNATRTLEGQLATTGNPLTVIPRSPHGVLRDQYKRTIDLTTETVITKAGQPVTPTALQPEQELRLTIQGDTAVKIEILPDL